MGGYNNNNYNRGSTLCFIALLFLGASSNYPFAHAQPNGVAISGKVCCTPTGNCPAGGQGQGVPRVAVRLNCTDNDVVAVSATGSTTSTDVNGEFIFRVPDFADLFYSLPAIPCNVSVHLPVNSVACPVLHNATGTLRSTVTVHDFDALINTPYNGFLLKAALDGFVKV